MNRIIITAGKKYIDIDAYAGIFGYRNLLRGLGYQAYAFTTAPANESVCPLMKELNFQFDEVDVEPTDEFIILDVSNPDFFDSIVNQENIIEVIDHHTGYEEYWKNMNHVKDTIEFIGSVCTIIYERYKAANQEQLLDTKLCKLLMAGILDNTLNLKASIMTQRDIDAYEALKRIGKVEDDYREAYFNSCYQDLENNLKTYIESDIKIEQVSELLPSTFGQLIVLDKSVIFNNLDIVKAVFEKCESWIFNVICLEDGKSYLLHSFNATENLEQLFSVPSKDGCIVLEHFLLRKQIMKKAKEV